jgi:sugar lactone lactonase YvrE
LSNPLSLRPNNCSISLSIDLRQSFFSFITATSSQLNILLNAKWAQNGITLTNSHEELTQLQNPCDVYVDDDRNLVIADFWNHRIVEWKYGATSGKVVAGGNGEGNQNNQLNRPTNVIVDKQTGSLIICDRGNRRVMRWPRRDGTTGQTLISNVACCNLTIDDDGFLYVSDEENHEVRRWRVGETQGTLVAGGNGQGHRLDQLNSPTYIYVDHDHSVYVSDLFNHRVMKWVKGATEGIVVAGGQGQGDKLTQLSHPRGLFVDQSGTVYVVDCTNHRVMCWFKGAETGNLVVGGNGQGRQANQLYCPMGLSFDRHGNLYVVDQNNDRVQRFNIELT